MRIPTMGLSECKSLFSSTENLNFLFILFILQKQQQSPHAARHKASLSPVQERLTSSSLILPLIEPILPFFPSFHCSISSCLSSFKRPSWLPLSLRLFTSWCLHSFFLIVLAQAGISSSAPQNADDLLSPKKTFLLGWSGFYVAAADNASAK